MDRAPTIRDIAAAAGVHNATVSRALRNDPRIPAATRERIAEEARRLGYRVNPVYASLMANVRAGRLAWHSETIAYVTAPGAPQGDWRKNHAFREIYQGVCARAEALGMKLDVFEEKTIIGPRLDAILKARGIRGVVIGMIHPDNVPGPVALSWSRITAVQIEPHTHLPMLPGVHNDRARIVQEAFARTRELGYRRAGLAIPAFWDRYGHWLSGYLGAAWGLPKNETVRPFYPTTTWNRAGFARWLRQERPEVILTLDRAFVWRWLGELGFRVPGDVAYAELDLPPDDTATAGIRQSHQTVGAEAVSLLASRLYHNDTGPVDRQMMLQISGQWKNGATAPPK
ncbi:transcriptional regulator [Opitutaceae bacterium TAV1]|nr:transcriptional regulator [Opitutaceae bacterium TAV1]